MATSALSLAMGDGVTPSPLFHPKQPKPSSYFTSKPIPISSFSITTNPKTPKLAIRAQASATNLGLVQQAIQLVQSSPTTWESAILTNLGIFVLGSPLLVYGLSLSGIGASFLLGTLTWRAFGPSGFLLVAAYFITVSLKL